MSLIAKLTIAAGVVLLALEGATALPRIRFVLLAYAIIGGALLVMRRRLVAPHWKVFVTVAVVSVLPALAVFRFPDPTLAALDQLLPILSGWSVLLVLLPLIGDGASVEGGINVDWRPTRSQVFGMIGAAFVLLAATHRVFAGDFAFVSDEAIYVTQSRWIAPGQLTWRMDADLAPFFIIRKVDYMNGHLYGMYPPGWPFLLALFRMAGLEWWSSVILGTASVALIYLVGEQLHGRRTGAVAAILLATSQVFLSHHAGYMAHAPAITALLGATWCMLRAAGAIGSRQLVYGLSAGVLLGFVVTVRPLTGVTLGTSVVLLAALHAWEAQRRLPLMLAPGLLIGGLIPGALLMYYNTAILGSPTAVSYQVMSPGSYDLGFGMRGVRTLNPTRGWVPGTYEFGFAEAMRDLFRRISGINTTFVPVGLLAPIAATAVAAGYRIPWTRIAMFALLPAAHIFYWYSGLRLYAELLPFVFLGTAAMLVFIYDRWPAMAKGFLGALLISQVAVAIPRSPESLGGHRPWKGSDYVHADGRRATVRAADSVANVHGKILLFSREGSVFDNQIDRLYQFNGSEFDGRVLVVRDRGVENASLIARFPDRVPFLVEDQGAHRVARFSRIAR